MFRIQINEKTSSRVRLLWAITGAGLSMPAFCSLLLDEAVTAREAKLERSKSRRRDK